jgi:hypothetical protein
MYFYCERVAARVRSRSRSEWLGTVHQLRIDSELPARHSDLYLADGNPLTTSINSDFFSQPSIISQRSRRPAV